jgi:hypothetical protein
VQLDLQVLMVQQVQLDLLVLVDLKVLLDQQVLQALRVPLALLDQLEQLDLQVPLAARVPPLRSLTTTLQRLAKLHLAAAMPIHLLFLTQWVPSRCT